MDVVQYLGDRGVFLSLLKSTLPTPPFTPEELELAANFSNDTRRKEFILGRRAAREVLVRAGFCGEAKLHRSPRGGPHWPNGYTGSISHADGLIGSVATTSAVFRSIGLDIECRTRNVSPKLGDRISVANELELGRSPLEIFSIKEACYKAIRPLSDRTFEFKRIILAALTLSELSFSLDSHGQQFSGTVVFGYLENHFAAVAMIPANGAGSV